MSETRELTAFRQECAAVETTLRQAPPDAAAWPGLGAWRVDELVGHLVGVAGRLGVLDPAEPGTAASVDRLGYYRPAPGPTRRFDDPALPVERWAQAFASARQATERRYAELGDDAVLVSPTGAILAVEYLATRVLELVVHHRDVRAALDLPPAGTVEAERITMSILEGLLEGPRPRNLGRQRFILAATGRVEVDDPRFPVLR